MKRRELTPTLAIADQLALHRVHRDEQWLCGVQPAATKVSGKTDVRLYTEGDELYNAMLGAIDSALTSIAMEAYIFEMDTIGHAFVAALNRAAARGARYGFTWMRPAHGFTAAKPSGKRHYTQRSPCTGFTAGLGTTRNASMFATTAN